MLFEINEKNTLHRYRSKWRPTELDIERFIVSSDSESNILEGSIFGEPLLIISNQVVTRFKKRADILAIDKYGNGVIIELKRELGALGVETQALQYLSDFSSYKGIDFVKRFSQSNRNIEGEIRSFIGGNADLKDVNKSSRIILLARDFDRTIYSMGEWLANQGVPFRCIRYEPIEINKQKFISFGVSFDRSKDILHPVFFGAVAREPSFYWHNIARADQSWWNFLKKENQIPACFDNEPGDQGEKILTSYISGDVIVAYSKGYGAIGWGIVERPDSYHIAETRSPEDHLGGHCLHRLSINWQAVAAQMSDGLSPSDVRTRFDIYHPISTSVSIDPYKAKNLIKELSQKFSHQ